MDKQELDRTEEIRKELRSKKMTRYALETHMAVMLYHLSHVNDEASRDYIKGLTARLTVEPSGEDTGVTGYINHMHSLAVEINQVLNEDDDDYWD